MQLQQALLCAVQEASRAQATIQEKDRNAFDYKQHHRRRERRLWLVHAVILPKEQMQFLSGFAL